MDFTLQSMSEYLITPDPAHDPTSDIVDLMSKVLDISVKQWQELSALPLNSLTSDLVHKNMEVNEQINALQYSMVIDDPTALGRVTDLIVAQRSKPKQRRLSHFKQQMLSDEEHKKASVSANIHLCELIIFRQRLIETWHETEILSCIYQNHCVLMGQETHHVFMRCVPFETRLDAFNPSAEDPEIRVNTGKFPVDGYKSTRLRYAISELDDDMVKALSFISSESVRNLVNEKGVARIKTALKAQVSQKNSLIVGIYYNEVGLDLVLLDNSNSKAVFAKDVIGDPNQTTSGKQDAGATSKSIQKREKAIQIAALKDSLKEKFFSIKERKSAVREAALQLFSKRYSEIASKTEEINGNKQFALAIDNLKDEIVGDYCELLAQDLSRFALRVQIYRYYESLKVMLKDFPKTYLALSYLMPQVENLFQNAMWEPQELLYLTEVLH